uniref:Uncharacterized protein n=1 Tax=Romanomermis culicivorax TaxID=13658 RepID=A0A915K271_ROMCU
MILSYRQKERATVTATVVVAPAPSAPSAVQRPPPGILTDSALEVVAQLEWLLLNWNDLSSPTNAMRAVWSTYLAKKYRPLPWELLKEGLEVEVLLAADLMLSAHPALQILGPEVTRRAIEFIANSTIWATPVDKILLDGKPSSPAVDAIPRAVEQTSQIA